MQTIQLNPKSTQFDTDGTIILLRTGGLSTKAEVKIGVTCQPLPGSPWYLLYPTTIMGIHEPVNDLCPPQFCNLANTYYEIIRRNDQFAIFEPVCLVDGEQENCTISPSRTLLFSGCSLNFD
uniref:Uncharacterized protein n=1 Tax=Romanomermis culicivorax TaxID=13658 RepID=A0A915J421_ROMCU